MVPKTKPTARERKPLRLDVRKFKNKRKRMIKDIKTHSINDRELIVKKSRNKIKTERIIAAVFGFEKFNVKYFQGVRPNQIRAFPEIKSIIISIETIKQRYFKMINGSFLKLQKEYKKIATRDEINKMIFVKYEKLKLETLFVFKSKIIDKIRKTTIDTSNIKGKRFFLKKYANCF